MLVVIAGIKRSGSTAQFNMVRLILEKKYSVYCTGNPQDISNTVDVNIIKIHPFSSLLYDSADCIFTTDRSSSEIERSLDNFKPNHRKPMEEMRSDLNLWKRRSICMNYNEIVKSPLACIQKIITIFDVDVDANEILTEFLKIRPPKEGYDPTTFLFHNHISKK